MSIQLLADLPGQAALIMAFNAIFVFLALRYFYRDRNFIWSIDLMIFILLGACWMSFHARNYLDHKLPETLAGEEFYVEGVIQGIPRHDKHVQRFILDVSRFEKKEKNIIAPERLRLSWYYGSPVKAGEHWRLLVRLKPPHGFMSPGSFDYEGWLYQKNIHATGYVRKSEKNRKLVDAQPYSLNALREKINTEIQYVLTNKEHAGLISALAVGDRSSISNRHWDTLIRTGTNHLVAISGLHIGLAAAFGFWIVRRLLPVWSMKYVPAQHLAILAGWFVALGYALLAGLSIPTQRALLMLSCFVLVLLLKRNFKPVNAMAMALLVILLWDPVSVLSAGFWFSFLAVSIIFYVFSARLNQSYSWRERSFQWGWMQFSIALALFPFSLLIFQQTSLISPVANAILVPYVSFLVVPLVLLALLFMPVSSWLSGYLITAANELLALIWPFVEALSVHPWAYWVKSAPTWPTLILALLGVVLLLAPRGFPVRWLGVVLLLPVVFNIADRPAAGDYEVAILDVGQGLSVALRTRHHVMVFDAGNKFSSRLDAGKAVVLPFLRHWSINQLDKLVISHGDADHIGGAQAIIDKYPETAVIGQDIEAIIAKNKKKCLRGDEWQWDGINFEFLHPGDKNYARRNNHACVLSVSGPGGNLLITSDIEKKAEMELLEIYGEKLQAQVLVVPHHGSKTSSNRAFIDKVDPQIAVFPAGYMNRYRHPKAEIVERYEKRQVTTYQVGHAGSVGLLFKAGQAPRVSGLYRKSHRKYWNHIFAD